LVLFGSLNNKVNPYIGYRIYAYTTATNRNRVLHDQSKRGGGIMT
jgi:hypothetical protein